MNQRIQQLIHESTGYTMSVYETNGVRTFGEREEFFDKAKFARLLKEECCAVIADLSHDYQAVGAEDTCKALSIANARIVAHFGVE